MYSCARTSVFTPNYADTRRGMEEECVCLCFVVRCNALDSTANPNRSSTPFSLLCHLLPLCVRTDRSWEQLHENQSHLWFWGERGRFTWRYPSDAKRQITRHSDHWILRLLRAAASGEGFGSCNLEMRLSNHDGRACYASREDADVPVMRHSLLFQIDNAVRASACHLRAEEQVLWVI